jgi:hypothetical protein
MNQMQVQMENFQSRITCLESANKTLLATVIHLQQNISITSPIISEPLISADDVDPSVAMFWDAPSVNNVMSESTPTLDDLLAGGGAIANMMSVGDQHGMAMSYVHLCT